jgi:hypothetical protein
MYYHDLGAAVICVLSTATRNDHGLPQMKMIQSNQNLHSSQ